MKYLIFVIVFFLYSCAETNSKNNHNHIKNRPGHIGELVIGVLKSNDTASNCEQGHVQDRNNCRKRKQAKVDAINKSIKNHTEK